MDAFPQGFRPEAEYNVVEVTLEPGDRVVFCSDGIIEAENGIEKYSNLSVQQKRSAGRRDRAQGRRT